MSRKDSNKSGLGGLCNRCHMANLLPTWDEGRNGLPLLILGVQGTGLVPHYAAGIQQELA